MKRAAISGNLRVLVVPLRPTRKADFPTISMKKYLSWSDPQGRGAFDPWLRKHIQLGAQIVKIAPASMTATGTVVEWRKWTGLDVQSLVRNAVAQHVRVERDGNRLYVEIPFKGGLVPLKYYVLAGVCVYTEPNVWLFHKLEF
ncbi:hypothetical protein BDW74DRAFT_171944 [Aspergillus multicolor]|uniref:uncharacterized protein n=1 Tax=Aspergillus multicolor TaxID=41759 RepID=UPI003CCE27F6